MICFVIITNYEQYGSQTGPPTGKEEFFAYSGGIPRYASGTGKNHTKISAMPPPLQNTDSQAYSRCSFLQETQYIEGPDTWDEHETRRAKMGWGCGGGRGRTDLIKGRGIKLSGI